MFSGVTATVDKPPIQEYVEYVGLLSLPCELTSHILSFVPGIGLSQFGRCSFRAQALVFDHCVRNSRIISSKISRLLDQKDNTTLTKLLTKMSRKNL